MWIFCKQTRDWESLVLCLKKTEQAKNFSHLTTAQDFRLCHELLGEESFLAYLCYDPNGYPVSAHIRLFMKNGISIAWSQGTDRKHLKFGVNQLTYFETFKEMTSRKGEYFTTRRQYKKVANAKAAGAPSFLISR